MEQPSPRNRSNDDAPQPLIQRLDRVAGEMNTFLLMIALGLGGLYFTSFLALKIATMPAVQFNHTAVSAAPTAASR
jgi:hypothetical protein